MFLHKTRGSSEQGKHDFTQNCMILILSFVEYRKSKILLFYKYID